MSNENIVFSQLYETQINNQLMMLRKGDYDGFVDFITKTQVNLPVDHPIMSSYHIQHLISEIGEVLDADKRWKSSRNAKNDSQQKLMEIADCFIVIMNIAIWSGYSGEELCNAINDKLNIVKDRIKESM